MDATRNDSEIGLVEEGEAFMRLGGRELARDEIAARRRAAEVALEARTRAAVGGAGGYFPVVVIGAGQAGLSVGYHLARLGLRFVILDAEARVGDVWRRRWDSLRLFTPARYDGLDGMPFPAPPSSFPTKDEMADYLEGYAARFHLPVRSGTRVDGLFRRGGRYVVQAGALQFEADQVVVAMASYQRPKLPAFAAELAPDIVQLHSSAYKNPGQLRPGATLLVGGGNSGAEIAVELARGGRRVWMAGRDVGHVPFRIGGWLARLLAPFLFRVVFHRLLTIRTPMGRKAQAKANSKGAPLIRTRPSELAAAGVERLPRVAGVRDGKPVLDDGRVLDVANVVWSTGYHPGFSWIQLPIFGRDGEPEHDGGVARHELGLYFVGLHFLYAMSSTMIHGVGRDARRIVRAVAERARVRQVTRAEAAAAAAAAATSTAAAAVSSR
jgi:putative flavoprotein involved in K+ transport